MKVVLGLGPKLGGSSWFLSWSIIHLETLSMSADMKHTSVYTIARGLFGRRPRTRTSGGMDKGVS